MSVKCRDKVLKRTDNLDNSRVRSCELFLYASSKIINFSVYLLGEGVKEFIEFTAELPFGFFAVFLVY